MSYSIYIGIDPGLNGGVFIFDKQGQVSSIPITIKNKKKRYDLPLLVKQFKPYSAKKVLCGIEMQSVRPGEGSVSSHTNGVGFGSLIGIAHAFEFEVDIISPLRWKKFYPNIENSYIVDLKEQQKLLRAEIKNIEEKGEKKAYNKEIEKLSRQIKKEAKNNSRLIAQELYPYLSDELKKVQDDGKADAILIGHYLKENF